MKVAVIGKSEGLDFQSLGLELVTNVADADFVFSVGGDGTFLKAASEVGALGKPIVGVNKGRLGYLADLAPNELASAVEDLRAGRYHIECHTVIEAVGFGCALNEVAILKRDTAAMISVRVSIDNEYVATYQADGLILSTPTGSTAYNLSNGGPIIVPSADALCLTPVAPHSLTCRPIVINGDSELKLEVESRSQHYLLALDGKSTSLRVCESASLLIRKADYCVNIVKFEGRSYYKTLREKLMWGVDSRK